MKLQDLINEITGDPVKDYFYSKAPYDYNNRGGTKDIFDYSEEHIMRLTRGNNLFVSPTFWEPLLDILKDKDLVEKTIADWFNKKYGENTSGAILEKSSGMYYASPNSKTIDPEKKTNHMMKHMFGVDYETAKVNRKEQLERVITGLKKGIVKAIDYYVDGRIKYKEFKRIHAKNLEEIGIYEKMIADLDKDKPE